MVWSAAHWLTSLPSRGEYDSARVVYLKVVETASAKGDTLTQARALTQAGLAAWHRGDYVGAAAF